MDLLWQCSMQKAMDWQGRIFAAYSEGGASWKKVVLYIWWDHCSIIYFELFNCIQTLSADLYSKQQQPVHENFWNKRSAFISWRNVGFSLMTRGMIEQESCRKIYKILAGHSSYSADLASSDFNLFLNLQNALDDKNFLKKIRWKSLWKISWAQNQMNFT